VSQFSENPFVLSCRGNDCVGLITRPASTVSSSGVVLVIVVGGPQYRIGSHRQFVQIARSMASRGHSCIRFDFPGMGDSEGPLQGFEAGAEDLGSVLMWGREEFPHEKLVLFGLCDGATAILIHLG